MTHEYCICKKSTEPECNGRYRGKGIEVSFGDRVAAAGELLREGQVRRWDSDYCERDSVRDQSYHVDEFQANRMEDQVSNQFRFGFAFGHP